MTSNKDADDLIDSVQSGHDIRLQHTDSRFTHKGVTPLDGITVHSQGTRVTGHQTIDLSIESTSNGLIQFQYPRNYYYVLFQSSDGSGKATRWFTDTHRFTGNSADTYLAEWLADSCWSKVLSQGTSGKLTYGTITALKNAINQGRRVRVVLTGDPAMAFEPETLILTPSSVVAQKTRLLLADAADLTKADDSGRWDMHLVSSSGTLSRSLCNIGDDVCSVQDVQMVTADWFVETRAYDKVCSL